MENPIQRLKELEAELIERYWDVSRRKYNKILNEMDNINKLIEKEKNDRVNYNNRNNRANNNNNL